MSTWEVGPVPGMTDGTCLLGWPCRSRPGNYTHVVVAVNWAGDNLWVAVMDMQGGVVVRSVEELAFDPKWKRGDL